MAIHPLSAAIYCNKWKLKTLNINKLSVNIDLFYSIMNKKVRESQVEFIFWEYHEDQIWWLSLSDIYLQL